ncbi:MAG: SIS domain-containing protein [Candidatus Thorarchaeota archaeon]
MTKFLDACYKAITKQKTAIRDTINSADTSAASAISGSERVILTGCGDSLAVANYGKWVLLKKGINALTVSPPEIEQIGLDDKSILIAISASGRSLTTIDSLRTAGDMGVSTILLTDNPEGSATEYAENVWLTKSHVASYDISPSSPTTSAMAYLLTVASDIKRDYDELNQDLKILKSKGGQILEWGEEEGKKIAPIINPSGRLYLISDGVNYAAAEIGMCKVNEYSLTFANAILTEEFRHHYNLAVEKGDSAVLVSNSNAEMISYMKALKEILGMRVYHLRPDDELNLSTPLSQVFPNSIALQMAAYYAVVEYQPNKDGWKKPNVSAFEIY